ncbi:MAG: zinc-ribbon domain-containing protein [Candidatus Fimousia sp.]
MKCKECGTKMSDVARFCPKCGTEVKKSKNTTIISILLVLIFSIIAIAGYQLFFRNEGDVNAENNENAVLSNGYIYYIDNEDLAIYRMDHNGENVEGIYFGEESEEDAYYQYRNPKEYAGRIFFIEICDDMDKIVSIKKDGSDFKEHSEWTYLYDYTIYEGSIYCIQGIDEDLTLEKVDLDTNQGQRLKTFQGYGISNLRGFSGDRYYYINDNCEICSLTITDDKPEETYIYSPCGEDFDNDSENEVYHLSASGKYVCYKKTTDGEYDYCFKYNLETGEETLVEDREIYVDHLCDGYLYYTYYPDEESTMTIYRMNLDTEEIQELGTFSNAGVSYDICGDKIFVTEYIPEIDSEIQYILSTDDGEKNQKIIDDEESMDDYLIDSMTSGKENAISE